MRLWHYALIKVLPDLQLKGQWRELNSIFKKQDKHILIDYVYEYPKKDLEEYTKLILIEMYKRDFEIKSYANADNYFEHKIQPIRSEAKKYKPFKKHHNARYLNQCFYNLQEKFDRGQKDFDFKRYTKIKKAVMMWNLKNLNE